MSLTKNIIFILFIFLFTLVNKSLSEEVKNIGKFKDWETMILTETGGKVCFAQTKPILQAPKSNKREAKLFVTFRPYEKITDEISITPGYEFNKNNSVTAVSG